MIVSRCYDYSIIYNLIIKNEEMYDRISEDNAETYIPDILNEYWLTFENDDNQLVGAFRFHMKYSATWEIHALILQEHRKAHSQEAAKLALKWALENIEGLGKLVCSIPVIYKDVYHFTKKNGFSDEGINRNCFTKNGELLDMYMLGATKQEIENFLLEK